MTVLSGNIVAHTAFGEPLDPEALRLDSARFFEHARTVIERHGGTIESSATDRVTAVFGVPAAREDDAMRAVRAAIEIRDALPDLRIEARIGVSTGEVIAGSAVAGHGLVTGAPVADSQRLAEGAAPGEVLIADSTLALVRDAADVEPAALPGHLGASPAYRIVRVRESPERSHRMPFVGRERELALVRDTLEHAWAEQQCELVTVVGQAGAGKSRIAAELLASSEAQVLRTRCLPYGEGITYWPVTEVLEQLALVPEDKTVAAAIGSLLQGTDTAIPTEVLAWAFRKTLEQAATVRPVVVVFDDIHWGEETFLELIEHVALLSSGAPILVLCLARPELLARRPDWPVTIRLPPLGGDDVEKLLPENIRARCGRGSSGSRR